MGKKKKKKKKQASKPLQDLTPAQLLQAGEAALRSDTPKAAVDVLRFAAKKHGLTPELKPCLLRAHLSHAAQLKRQGLAGGAAAAAGQAEPLLEDVSWLTEADLVDYISLDPGAGAFSTYTRYVRYYQRVPEAEAHLAGHLFRSRRWALADHLDRTVPLKAEVDIVEPAVDLMDQANWETALAGLQRLPRRSPFAPVRLLCRAMSAFYAGNDGEAARALGMIPDHFPLAGVSACLAALLSTPTGTDAWAAAASRLPLLWKGPIHIRADVQALTRRLDRGDVHGAASQMRRIARSAAPENPRPLLALLLQIAWRAVLADKLDRDDYLKLASALLPGSQAESLLERLMMSLHMPLTHAGKYITSHLAADFPDPAEQGIAHATVLLHVVSLFRRIGLWEEVEEEPVPGPFRDALGLASGTDVDRAVAITAKALRLDPGNRSGYHLLAELPRPGRPDRKTVEAALLEMMETFPDDPFPCLALASVYYENNAFRKAEHILEEALRRAPHDHRVIDKHALSLLISAEKNIRREKFHLAGPDIDRAGTLESRGAAPYIAAKRTLLALINPLSPDAVLRQEGAQMSLFGDEIDFTAVLDRELSALSPTDRLRMLAFLIPDLEAASFSQKKSILKLLTRRLKADLKAAEGMPGQEIVRLISPLEKDYSTVFHQREPAPLFLKHDKQLLARIPNETVVDAYDIIMAPETLASIQRDIRRRLKQAGGKDEIILAFCLAVVRRLSGESASYAPFHDILDQVHDTDVKEALRRLSRRFSRHATGSLRHALAHFHFGPAPGEDPQFLFDDDEDDDDLFYFDEEEAPWEGGPPGMDLSPELVPIFLEQAKADPGLFAEMMEQAVDNMDLRGAPDREIKEVRGMMTAVPEVHDLFDQLARGLDPALPEMAGMSREARIFLYGRSPGKKTRKRR